MMKRLVWFFTIIFFITSLLGCATITGPSVSRAEIEKARQELTVKALAFRIKQLQRVTHIGNRIMRSIFEEDTTIPAQPFLGLGCSSIDKYLQQVFNLSVEEGVVVLVVKEKSPADKAGVQPGDVVRSINNTPIKNFRHYTRLVSRLKIADSVRMEILRGKDTFTVATHIDQIPINTPIIMVDKQEVNAATDGESIFVTYGLLNFTQSDDEIAAVIGHELAHAVRGHVKKMQGSRLLGLIAALTLGAIVEHNAPGVGQDVMRGVDQLSGIFSAKYSRDLEREADYFGTKFVYLSDYDVDVCTTFHERFAIEIPASMIQNYLSTHPSSPERVVRVRKTIEELKTGPSGSYLPESQ